MPEPKNREDLAKELITEHETLGKFFEEMDTGIFFAKPPKGWSPEQNIRHLYKACFALRMGMLTPKPLLRLIFGRSKRASRAMSEISGDYLHALAQGAGAGMYAPMTAALSPAREKQNRLVKSFVDIGKALSKSVLSWSEEDLDTIRLPHPILGLLPVREMVLFGILHGKHHSNIVRKRLAA